MQDTRHKVTARVFRQTEPLPTICGRFDVSAVTKDWEAVDCVACLAQRPQPKCAACGKPRLDHKAGTYHCPGGRKHRTHGYGFFHQTQVFVPKETT